jgi:hypothetical protein
MKKASKTHGKKYLLVTADGLFGPKVLYADSIRAFPSFDRESVKRKESAIWKAEGDKVFRVGLNGHKH